MLLPFDREAVAPSTVLLDRWAHQLDARVLPRRWFGRLRRALEAEAVAASTSMEGVPITVDDTLKILAGDRPEHVSAYDQALVRGYRDAMTYVQRRADDGLLRWDRELVVAVQDRALGGNFASGAGRLRQAGGTWMTNSQTGDNVFRPPDHEQVAGLVDEMCATMEAADWHPALAAAWIHVALAAIHPFADGNGRTLSAQLSQIYELALRQRTEGLLWTVLENLLEERGLPPRLANALYDSFFGRDVTTGYYRDLIDASPATARTDLQRGVAAGFLLAIGETRGRRYQPGHHLMPAIADTLGVEVKPERNAILATLILRANNDAAGLLPSPDALQRPLPGLE